MSKKNKKVAETIHISLEEIIKMDRAARRAVAIEEGKLSHFKTGNHGDQKKETSKKKCRGKCSQDGWE